MDTNQPQYAEKITIEEYNRQKDEYTLNALKELQQQMMQTKQQTNQQINQQPKKQTKSKILNKTELDNSDNNSDSDANSVIEYTDDEIRDIEYNDDEIRNMLNIPTQTNVNLIIKHVSDREKSKTDVDKSSTRKTSKKLPVHERNNSSSTMTDAIYAQHELDIKTIQSLKDLIAKLNKDLDCESSKNHYLKLDLNNAQCDNNDLKKQNKFLQTENENKQKQLIELRKNIISNEFNIMIMKFIIVLLFLFAIIY